MLVKLTAPRSLYRECKIFLTGLLIKSPFLVEARESVVPDDFFWKQDRERIDAIAIPVKVTNFAILLRLRVFEL